MLLLGEGISSVAAEQAAKALMALAASEINKACTPHQPCISRGQCIQHLDWSAELQPCKHCILPATPAGISFFKKQQQRLVCNAARRELTCLQWQCRAAPLRH